jgi:hypothetical protein
VTSEIVMSMRASTSMNALGCSIHWFPTDREVMSGRVDRNGDADRVDIRELDLNWTRTRARDEWDINANNITIGHTLPSSFASLISF